MNARTQELSRIVISLRVGTPNRPALRFVAEFTKRLDLQLHGLLAEDRQLMRAAQLPFTREFRRLQGAWSVLGSGDLSRDLDSHLAQLRREIISIARTAGLSPRFELGRATTLEDALPDLQGSDIIVVAEPDSAVDRAVHPFADLTRRALESAACVLLVPCKIARPKGEVFVLAQGPDDPAIRRAASIAASDGAPLRAIEAKTRPASRGDFLSQIARAPMVERLIVMDRATAGIVPPWDIATLRHSPVLVTGPVRDVAPCASGDVFRAS